MMFEETELLGEPLLCEPLICYWVLLECEVSEMLNGNYSKC